MLALLFYIIAIIAFVLFGIKIEHAGAGRISLDYAFFAVVISTVFVLLVLSSIKSKLNDIINRIDRIDSGDVSYDIHNLSDDVEKVREEVQDIKDQTDDIKTISRKVARLSADVHEIKKSVGHQTDDDDDGYDDYDDDDEYANI